MAEKVHLIPGLIQVRCRMGFSPPNYKIVSVDTAGPLATKFAEIFNLKSTSLVFNQNSTSGQFLYFRYFLPVEVLGVPVSALPNIEVALGVDQVEIFFSNPPTATYLRKTSLSILEPILSLSSPTIADQYYEVSVHASSKNGDAKEFLDKVVLLPVDTDKGFSFAKTFPNEDNARASMMIDTSTVIKGGLFVFFTYTRARKVNDVDSVGSIMDCGVRAYREFQSVGSIQIEEPAET